LNALNVFYNLIKKHFYKYKKTLPVALLWRRSGTAGASLAHLWRSWQL